MKTHAILFRIGDSETTRSRTVFIGDGIIRITIQRLEDRRYEVWCSGNDKTRRYFTKRESATRYFNELLGSAVGSSLVSNFDIAPYRY